MNIEILEGVQYHLKWNIAKIKDLTNKLKESDDYMNWLFTTRSKVEHRLDIQNRVRARLIERWNLQLNKMMIK